MESFPKKDKVFQLFAAVDSLSLTTPRPQMVFTLQYITPFISLSLVSTLPLSIYAQYTVPDQNKTEEVSLSSI